MRVRRGTVAPRRRARAYLRHSPQTKKPETGGRGEGRRELARRSPSTRAERLKGTPTRWVVAVRARRSLNTKRAQGLPTSGGWGGAAAETRAAASPAFGGDMVPPSRTWAAAAAATAPALYTAAGSACGKRDRGGRSNPGQRARHAATRLAAAGRRSSSPRGGYSTAALE